MPRLPSYLAHLKSSQDLVTTHAQTRAGFITAALTKARLADPFVHEARTLRALSLQAETARALLEIPDIRMGLLAASGTSLKAANVLLKEDVDSIVEDFVSKVLEPAGEGFREELVYRFLLTKGDTLGGQIRNIAGSWAKTELNRRIQAHLGLTGREYSWFSSQAETWLSSTDVDGRENAKALTWNNALGRRTLVYDRKVSLIRDSHEENEKGGKNVDLILLDCEPSTKKKEVVRPEYMRAAGLYIALGELKGGIDPAGADEHWKTANSALNRIRVSFAGLQQFPKLIFIGRAIEESMAREIWVQLQRSELSHAANLNNDSQIAHTVAWLCGL